MTVFSRFRPGPSGASIPPARVALPGHRPTVPLFPGMTWARYAVIPMTIVWKLGTGRAFFGKNDV